MHRRATSRANAARALTATMLAVLTLTSCSSSSSPGSTGADTSTPPSSPSHGTAGRGTTTPPPPSDQRAVAAIKRTYVAFFSGDTSASRKIDLVQNGLAFAQVINAQADTPIAKGTTASVSKVTLVTPTQANVVYTVSLAGTPALKNQAGIAINDGGTWKVGTTTFCALLTLEQQAPPICQGLP